MKHLTSFWACLVVLGLLVSLKISNPTFVESIKLNYYDMLIRQHKKELAQDIVLVDIDEKAIAQEGQYPWPRDLYANKLSPYSLNALTMIFSEKDRFNGDSSLATSMQQSAVVLASAPTLQTSDGTGLHVGVSYLGNTPNPYLYNFPGLIYPLQDLAVNASGIGVTASVPDVDGVIRSAPIVTTVGETLYPSFSLEILRVMVGEPSYQMKVGENGVEWIRMGRQPPITTSSTSDLNIAYWYDFERVSAVDQLPEGKILVWGVTAEGVSNPVPTPMGAKYPHEVQAQILQTLMSGVQIHVPDYAVAVELLLLVVSSLSILALVYMLSTVPAVLLSLTILGGVPLALIHYWSSSLLFFDVTMISFSSLVMFAQSSFNQYYTTFKQKEQIKKQFGTYLSPDLVAQLQKQPELLKLGGTEQELSIMFTDVRGFTSISEHYGKDVQGLTSIMNRYMTAMTKAILENKGTLDKYIGDAQMAFWNAPVDNKQHALDAVRTAFQMMKSLEEFNDEIKQEGVPAFGMGLGINTDTVVVGNMGSDQRFDYTCLGDGVNLASRLEGQSKPYCVAIVVGPKTAKYVENDYQVVELDLLAVKGKTEPVKIYTIFDFDDAVGESGHKKFLEAYRIGAWDAALLYANDLKSCFFGQMNGYYDMMIDRINQFKNDTPKEWDGVYRATTK